jgi:hypothetical protein
MSAGSLRRILAVPVLLAAFATGSRPAAADAQPTPSPSPGKTATERADKKGRTRPAASVPPAASPRPTVTIRPTSPRPAASPHVFSNKDLPSPSPATEGEKQKGRESATAPPPPNPEATAGQFDADRQRRLDEEARWRERATTARGGIASADHEVTKLEQEAAALANRILLSTDTNEILRLRAEQQKVNESLAAARAALERARQALEDLQEEARRAGVPPGWVREP